MFFFLSRFVQIEGEFGPQKHPWQASVLATHGAFAFLMLLGLGALWLNHVPIGWRSHRSRRIGVTLVVITALMVISGWTLYYAADEQLRPLLGNLHFAVGVMLPLWLVWHVVRGRRERRHLESARAARPDRSL